MSVIKIQVKRRQVIALIAKVNKLFESETKPKLSIPIKVLQI